MKNSGKRISDLKVQKVAVTKEKEILALEHHLFVTEEIDENEFVLLLGLFFIHSNDKIRTLIQEEL